MSVVSEAVLPVADPPEANTSAGVPPAAPLALARYRAQPETWRDYLRIAALYGTGFVIMTIGSVLMLVVGILTLFRARRLYCEGMAAALARFGLWMGGIKMRLHDAEKIPDGQVIYIANHWSTLDVFLLLALRLPNARFFLSGHLRRKLPMAVIGYLVGVFWTVPQRFQQQRVAIFRHADKTLRRTGESVFLSPEGNQGELDKLAPFNKGAFHLATSLHAPIVPLFINIPRSMNPGWGYLFRPGVVDIYFQPPIATDQWQLDDLDRNRADVREMFLDWHRQLQT